MTIEEANIAFKKRLLVTIKENSGLGFSGGIYKIMRISKFYDTKLKKFDYSCAIAKSDSYRTIYELDLCQIEPAPGYELVIQQFINQRRNALVENSIVKRQKQDLNIL